MVKKIINVGHQPQNKLKKRKEIKKRTCDLLEVSTYHGIPNKIRSKKLFTLIMWSLLTIISTSAGSYFIIGNMLDYLKN
jgi:hypothetical protein